MAKQLYDYWFVQFDFPDENGKPYKSSGGKMVWNEKLKREIPVGWSDGQLSGIANIIMGQSPDGSSYNEVGNGKIFYQGSTDFGIRFPSIRQYTTAPTRFAKKRDILMSVRAPVGATNIANNDCCIGRGLAALNSKVGSITHLYYIIDGLKTAFDQRNAAGTTFGSITKDDLFVLPVVVPNTAVLLSFEKVCSAFFEKQMIIGEEIDLLTKLRDSLLPLLMNGQVSVNYDLASIISQLHDVKKANFANHRGRQVTKFVYICAMRSVRARKAVEFCRKSRALSHENRAIFRTSCGIFAPFGHRAFAASTARTLPSPSTAPHRPTTGDTRLIYDIGRTPLYRQRHTPDRPRTPYIIYRTPAPWPACGYLGATPASTTPASCSHSPRPRHFSMRRTRLFGKIAYICAGAHSAGGKTIAFLRRNGEAPLNNRGLSARSPRLSPLAVAPSPHPPTVHRL